MTYRQSKKRREQNKRWSERSNAKQAQQRITAADPHPLDSIDKTIHITIQRPGTNEKAKFTLLEGNRITILCSTN